MNEMVNETGNQTRMYWSSDDKEGIEALQKELDTNALRQDWFLDPSCRIYQNPDFFCFNTDSRLLAQFARVKRKDTVLEIGCNNGAVLSWLDRSHPSLLIGVEILPKPAKLAAYNLSLQAESDWKIFAMDIEDFSCKSPGLEGMDVIVCNPPFFEVDDRVNWTMRQLGRFEVSLNIEKLLANASRLLKSYGRLYLVHRPDRLADLLEAMKQVNIAPVRLAIVYDKRDSQPKSILLEGIKEGSCRLKVEPLWWIE